MNNEYVHKILNEKIAKDDKIVKIRIDDVNLSIQDTFDFIQVAKKELKERGYKKFILQGKNTYLEIKNLLCKMEK